jgi:hypothetical protein
MSRMTCSAGLRRVPAGRHPGRPPAPQTPRRWKRVPCSGRRRRPPACRARRRGRRRRGHLPSGPRLRRPNTARRCATARSAAAEVAPTRPLAASGQLLSAPVSYIAGGDHKRGEYGRGDQLGQAFVMPSLLSSRSTSSWAPTATVPTRAVGRSPTKAAERAGPSANKGPKWTVVGDIRSTALITATATSGITTDPRPHRRVGRRSHSACPLPHRSGLPPVAAAGSAKRGRAGSRRGIALPALPGHVIRCGLPTARAQVGARSNPAAARAAVHAWRGPPPRRRRPPWAPWQGPGTGTCSLSPGQCAFEGRPGLVQVAQGSPGAGSCDCGPHVRADGVGAGAQGEGQFVVPAGAGKPGHGGRRLRHGAPSGESRSTAPAGQLSHMPCDRMIMHRHC